MFQEKTNQEINLDILVCMIYYVIKYPQVTFGQILHECGVVNPVGPVTWINTAAENSYSTYLRMKGKGITCQFMMQNAKNAGPE